MVDLSYKVQLFSSDLVVETIRQWFKLIVYSGITIWLVVSALRLRQTFRSWLVLDTVLITSLALRVLLMLVYEFILPTRIFNYAADNIYILVLLMIFYSFSKSLYPSHESMIFNRFTYVIVILVILVGTAVYSFANVAKSFHCSDDSIYFGDEINSLILSVVELIVGIWNLIYWLWIIHSIDRKFTKLEEHDSQVKG